jgi:hypothetical protein
MRSNEVLQRTRVARRRDLLDELASDTPIERKCSNRWRDFVRYILFFAALASFYGIDGASAQTIIERNCLTDIYGNRACTETIRVVKKRRAPDRIIGMNTKKYIRGLQQGRCMPSPSGVPGVCGGE